MVACRLWFLPIDRMERRALVSLAQTEDDRSLRSLKRRNHPPRSSLVSSSTASSSASLQCIQDLVDLVGRQVLVVIPVHRHHRRAAARREALFFLLEEDASVGGALAQLDAQLLLAMSDDPVGAVQPARDVGADRHLVAPDR